MEENSDRDSTRRVASMRENLSGRGLSRVTSSGADSNTRNPEGGTVGEKPMRMSGEMHDSVLRRKETLGADIQNHVG